MRCHGRSHSTFFFFFAFFCVVSEIVKISLGLCNQEIGPSEKERDLWICQTLIIVSTNFTSVMEWHLAIWVPWRKSLLGNWSSLYVFSVRFEILEHSFSFGFDYKKKNRACNSTRKSAVEKWELDFRIKEFEMLL